MVETLPITVGYQQTVQTLNWTLDKSTEQNFTNMILNNENPIIYAKLK